MANAINLINSVAEILESLPAEETQHMLRVERLVDHFSRKLQPCGLVKEHFDECNYFGSAAFYHDIGKAWIPHDILTKPDKLTEWETSVIHKHPVFARRLFDRIRLGLISGVPEHLIQLAMDSAMYHHEYWDGSGYPYGISYDAIPLIARITTICDAYDAMTSDRIYRKAHSHDHACQELARCAGIQFDPELVRAFLAEASSNVLLSHL